ncbi:MarR family winged helix-turn-helix transcriptional regulator [Gluconacetobacter takamatsuzukensis]|uniref:MarR family transcriptional regulator n=1 Tax=Gluconacetobacter takamatsuzukensis TaxID=1286190 RepID=A0A7W4KDN2_9PROT|nr:MarR family transcriptional regulator [Gluconacetobacter takamatsuzukensis]MBB2205047.1 MarR family transcriptional regulator [Gluconacetobacter takamatsuzukensis]
MTETVSAQRVEDFLCFSLYAASHAFNRLYQPLLEPLGLTYPQYLVLTVLWAEDGLLVGQIGEKLALVSSTLTPLLKRLEGAGLVARTRDRQDERQVRVTLTEAGHAMRDRAAGIPACVLSATGLSLEKLLRLKDEIDALRHMVEQHKDNAGP